VEFGVIAVCVLRRHILEMHPDLAAEICEEQIENRLVGAIE
jgi:hypothetical protein